MINHFIHSMSKSNKKMNSVHRRKRMQRSSRLQAAQHWVTTYNGKNLIKGYQKWFAVNFACAVKELQILGVKLDDEYIRQVIHNQEKKLSAKRNAIEKKKQRQELEDWFIHSNDYFAYIIGYTSLGFPYGVTWEEMEQLEEDTLELSETKTA